VKKQLLVINRARRRAPYLSALHRYLFALRSLSRKPRRIQRAAVIIQPSTLLKSHRSPKQRKYRLLFLSGKKRKQGTKGLSQEPIQAIVAINRRYPGFGCPRIAQRINRTFGTDIDKDVLRRIPTKHFRPGSGDGGPSWLGVLGHTKDGLRSVDPLFRYHHWQANLRILEIQEIKTVPYVPLSHPFIERLIGTLRREFLDHVFFWNANDLERKLEGFRQYFNSHRVHSISWRSHPPPCRPQPIPVEISLPRTISVVCRRSKINSPCTGNPR